MSHKTLRYVGLGLAGLIVSSSALALDFSPYIGAELQYLHTKLDSSSEALYQNFQAVFGGTSKDNTVAGQAFIGARLMPSMGVELGYMSTPNYKSYTGVIGSTSAHLQTVYVDLMGYYPVAEQVELIGAIGAGIIFAKYHFNAAISLPPTTIFGSTEYKPAARIGLGLQYKLNE